MDTPRAYFLTWRCYGTWLHGDERGSVDETHNVYGAPVLGRDPTRQEGDSHRMTAPAYSLDANARQLASDTIRKHCLIRGWDLFALNVRTEHVHAVISCGAVRPEEALVQFKAWCTRRLRDAGILKNDAPAWSYHGSTQYLWKESDIIDAVAYVMDGQGNDLV